MKLANNIQPQYTPTLNNMGYMSPGLDAIQKSFVRYCKTSANYLDIGCGFGVATLPVLNKGCRVTACDLDANHLNILREKVATDKLSLLTLVKGHFPNEVSFPENYFDGVNFSMVLHFLSPSAIERAFKDICSSLKQGGRLFITTSSPYQRALSPFAGTYEKKRSVEEWPGYINDIADYVPHRAHILPKENIVFCAYELARLAAKFGFRVLTSRSFSRDGIPADLELDGREYSGLICEKPSVTSVISLEKYKARLPMKPANIK